MDSRGGNSGYRGRQRDGHLQHVCRLDIDAECESLKKTGVICTIGPSCDSVETLKQMMEEGMTICRIVMARGTHEEHLATIGRIREAEKLAFEQCPQRIAIAIDIECQAVHLGQLKSEFSGIMPIKEGQKIKLTNSATYQRSSDQENVYVNSAKFVKCTSVDDQIYLDMGPVRLIVTGKGDDYLECVVDVGGEIHDFDECHVPCVLPGNPVLTDKDKLDINFGLDCEIDMVFVSWASSSNLIQLVRREIGTLADEVKVIAKIENYEGVKRFKEMLKVSDGIMIARGNLGIDLAPEKVFLAQKMMIGLSNRVGKPVICATQMLQSMIKNPRPTRAEASDVANAVLDGADCVMLASETAIGKHPVKAVQTIAAICQQAEGATSSESVFLDIRKITPIPCENTQTIAITAVESAIRCKAAAIVLVTAIGRSASLIAQYRPPCHIVAITRSPRVAKCLHMHRGVLPVLYEEDRVEDWREDVDNRFHYGIHVAARWNILKEGDVVVMVTGMMPGSGSTNTTRIMTVPNLHDLLPITNIKYNIA